MSVRVICRLLGALFFLGAILPAAFAGPLEEASLRQVINDVRIVDPANGVRPAVPGDVIKDDLGVKTGIKSRAELVFQDQTLTRLGPETFFSFDPGTRDMTLNAGTMLLQVPKHIGGARIHTAAITASILGTTIMMEYLPGSSVKVAVLEGTLRLSLDHVLGETVLLQPGQMAIMRPDTKHLPDPVNVDLRLLIKTSRLINPKLFGGDGKTVAKELPSMRLINNQIALQQGLKGKQALIDTNLVISGQGTSLMLDTDKQLAALHADAQVVQPAATPAPAPAAPSPTPSPLELVTNPAATLGFSTKITTAGKSPVVTKGATTYPGATYSGATLDGRAADFLFGAESAFSLRIDFDGQFGLEGDTAFPGSGIAAYKFAHLTLQGNPTFITAGGPADVALIGVGGITDGSGSAFTWHIGSLNGLLLGANDGSITLGGASTLSAAWGSPLRWLQLYADGTRLGQGDVTINGAISIPTATLDIDAADNVTLGTASSPLTLTARAMDILGLKSVTINSALNADFIEIASTGITTINGALNAPSFTGLGPAFNLAGNLDADNDYVSGDLSVNGMIDPSSAGTVSSMRTLYARQITALGGLDFEGLNSTGLANSPTAGYQLTLTSPVDVTFAANAINGANFSGGDTGLFSVALGGDGGVFDIGTANHPIGGDVTFDVPVLATTGGNGLFFTTGGKGGTVNVISNGSITVNSTIQVSDIAAGHASAQGGNVSLTSNKKKGVAITVSNSGQILALLSAAAPGPGGTINITSAGGAINVNGGTVEADSGTVDIRNKGDGGVVNLTNATLAANVLKVGALGNDGHLIINGGTMSANGAIELYAGGSNGTVLFDGNVTLNGNSTKTIAGDTVTIDNGYTVTIGGSHQANVYTNNANYHGSGGNGSTTGIFAGAGAATHPFSAAPKF
jgi:hypothetical protein